MKATLYVLNEPDFIGNRIFSDLPINGVKNYGYMFAAMKRQLASQGINLSTQDINSPEESELIIAVDQVAFFQTYQRRKGQRLYLMLNEPATYYPEVWKKGNHTVFDRVFTYDYTLVDGQKYMHHYFAIDLDSYPLFRSVTEAEFNSRKLLVLMAGMFQLTKPKPGSSSLLYTRYQTLRWFGQHWPLDFDFFSRGIAADIYRSFRGLGILQRVLPKGLTRRIVDVVAARRRRPVEAISRGPIPPNDKLNVIRHYRFVICYENTRLPGYISEKIFDCLFSGCVPIYLGEPNISKFVPAECFIDRTAFATDAKLAEFIANMTYVEYNRYIAAMLQFVEGVERQKFGSDDNAQRVVEVVIADMAAR